jgi:hypothetical protein
MPRARAAVLAVLALATACVEDVQLGAAPDGGSIPGLASLTVEPPQATIAIDGIDTPPSRASFVARGRFVDGSERDVTELVAWRVDRPAPGGFVEPGVYETSNRAAGRVVVTAASGPIAADAALTVTITHTVIDAAYPPPSGADALFAPGTPVDASRPERQPVLLYPADGALAPADLAPMLFQWQPGEGNDAWRLAFDSDVLHLTVLTGADRWLPDGVIWTVIARSTAGSSIELAVAAGSTLDPSAIHVAPTADLGVSAAPAGGAILFRTDDGDAVQLAAPSHARASRFYPVPPDATCVSCHTVSRDGALVALGYGGESLRVVDAARNAVLVPDPARPMGWAAFSPDGALLVVADKGRLTLLDARTGEPAGPHAGGRVPLGMRRATHPDWSPSGDAIVVALGSTVENRDMKGGEIARIPFFDGDWGEPEVLVTSTGDDDNNFFPRWSPDGEWIAYVHAESPSRGAPTAELRLIRADGGAPLRLSRASGAATGSTMPSWAPAGGDVAWLAFTSMRPYGHLVLDDDIDHVWLAAVDLGAAASAGETEDPSFPALWLPGQEATAMQYLPVWGPEAGAPDP